MEVTHHRHYDGQYIYKKIESLHLQECSLKKGPSGRGFYIQYHGGIREVIFMPV